MDGATTPGSAADAVLVGGSLGVNLRGRAHWLTSVSDLKALISSNMGTSWGRSYHNNSMTRRASKKSGGDFEIDTSRTC